MKIILIGYRASGKSTVGKLLSQKLKVPFVDTDQAIEAAAGMPIKKLVAQKGWEVFREMETKAIEALRGEGPCIVATGGGAVLSVVNRDWLKNMGRLIYLKTPLNELMERLKRDAQGQQTRPQFTSGDLEEETIALLNERIPVYESAADFTVDTSGKSIVRVSEEIYRHLLEAGVVFDINKTRKKLNQQSQRESVWREILLEPCFV